jgi:predicted nucleotidyltransferase
MVHSLFSDQSWGRTRNRRGVISKTAIRRLVERIAELFHPDKIILFGSYAYGQPTPDSDVDLLVVMPARNEIDQALKLALAVDPPFGMDLIVRTPKNLKWRLEEGDWFLREAVGKGKLLYEKPYQGVGGKSRSRLRRRPKTSKGKAAIS